MKAKRKPTKPYRQLFREKYPRHFANFMAGDEDAETGDVFIQLCVLDDIVYG